MFSLAERHCVEIDGKPVSISALALLIFGIIRKARGTAKARQHDQQAGVSIA
jgi:hypothetical protein